MGARRLRLLGGSRLKRRTGVKPRRSTASFRTSGTISTLAAARPAARLYGEMAATAVVWTSCPPSSSEAQHLRLRGRSIVRERPKSLSRTVPFRSCHSRRRKTNCTRVPHSAGKVLSRNPVLMPRRSRYAERRAQISSVVTSQTTLAARRRDPARRDQGPAANAFSRAHGLPRFCAARAAGSPPKPQAPGPRGGSTPRHSAVPTKGRWDAHRGHPQVVVDVCRRTVRRIESPTRAVVGRRQTGA